jgi:trimeric autotransporter adhesin
MAIVRYPLRATALAPLLLGTALVSPVAAQQRIGVSGAVNPHATGISPGAVPRRLVLGQEVVFNERITTNAAGQTQVLFLDQSTMTVGPNSDMVIDEFVYDPAAGTGKLAASLTRGVFRYVGGKLSKQDNAVTMQTPSATIGIRGGLILIDLALDGTLQVIFGYGAGVTITGLNGIAQTITRPGFQVTVAGRGAAPTPPSPAPPGATAVLLTQLDGRPGGTGGARTIPTDTMVSNSGVAATISGNVLAGNQPQTFQQPPRIGTVVSQIVPTTTLQNTAVPQSVATQSTPVTPPSPPPPPPPPSPPPPPPPSPPPPPPPPPVVISYAGLVKSTAGNGANATTQGFINQSLGAGRIPYTNGVLTFPPGQPANGVFTTTLNTSVGPVMVQFPLAPGSVSPGFNNFGPAGTQSSFGAVTGTSYMATDSTFFYANLTPVNSSIGKERAFIFGGQAVPAASPLLSTAPGSPQLYTFALQPDAALQSPVPFITQSTGGNIPNPTISPYYVVAPARSAVGAFNPNTNPGAAGTRTLQASLAINGTGASQSSALVVQTGGFFTSTDTGTVAGSGTVRGSFLANGSAPPVRIGSGAATVPDGNGNNIFGTGTSSQPISGFVLDQNQYNGNLNFVPNQVATQVPLGGTASNYAFNQPAIPTTVSTFGTRTTQTTTGYFGGIMNPVIRGSIGSPYPATGTTSVQTNATNNQVAATFAGSDPFGTNTLTVQFGTVTGRPFSRAAFVDDTRYAALESPDAASQVNGATLPLPNPNAPSSTQLFPRVAMVTSGTVPQNGLLPNGLCSSCQFLQWGYWTGNLDTLNAAGTGVVRQDVAHLNPWVAGVISSSVPAAGTGTFVGNAFGAVFNNGASYLASGQFSNSWNFGTRSGTLAITNFDGNRGFSGPVATGTGATATYSGTLSGTNLTGTASGAFFGPLAPETAGNFAVKSVSGSPYLASGIFAGHR